MLFRAGALGLTEPARARSPVPSDLLKEALGSRKSDEDHGRAKGQCRNTKYVPSRRAWRSLLCSRIFSSFSLARASSSSSRRWFNCSTDRRKSETSSDIVGNRRCAELAETEMSTVRRRRGRSEWLGLMRWRGRRRIQFQGNKSSGCQ